MAATKLQTALGRARGLGSAKDGVHHWWLQRVTAVFLIPLALWLMITVVSLPSLEVEAARALVAQPLHGIALFFTLALMLIHARLGLQVVIEDYVHCACVRIGLLLVVQAVAAVGSLVALLAIGKLVIGA
jgi:succinate dehydrogenase / fumarate reductase, membrane anchor subunit